MPPASTSISSISARICLPPDVTSESQLHSQLNLAGRTQIAASTACGGNSAEIGGSDRAIGLREVGVVEDVECVRPELQVDPFGNWCGFGQGEVQVGKSRTSNDISSGI